ncbi:GNAT family protein [Kocuria marina]|uniref:hypothetical protein n=1 Tax=Kocuria marina TaxID=223184 RepID=UPI00119EE985|nr:hypothetical protein [Kocuria indica]
MSEMVVRNPCSGDVQNIIDLVYKTPGLDNNSPYFYNLWVRDWSLDSAVAISDGRLLGALLGYVRPTCPNTYFAWQSCIEPEAKEPDIAVNLFDFILRSKSASGVDRLEMSVDASNRRVSYLLGRLSRRYGSSVSSELLFSELDLGGEHYAEELITIPILKLPQVISRD